MTGPAPLAWLNGLSYRFRRKGELLRGCQWRWRGVHAGVRFGLGRGVRIVHPECLVVGDDVTIEDYAYLHCLSERGVRIGSHTSIDRNLWLHSGGTSGDHAHGWFEIGEHSFIGCNAVIGAGGGIRIGDNVLIGQSANLHSEEHVITDPTRPIREQGLRYSEIVIENGVWIGSRATILAGVTVATGAVVGAGAVVTHSVPAMTIVAGVPARPIGQRGALAP